MMRKTRPFFAFVILAGFVLSACKLPNISSLLQPTPASPAPGTTLNDTGTIQSWQVLTGGVEEIVGAFSYTNEFYPETYAYEHAVMLLDMHGFVERDFEWEIPAESQVIGMADLDFEQNSGTFNLQLPVRPRGTINDLDQDGKKDNGVQVFAVEYAPNIAQALITRRKSSTTLALSAVDTRLFWVSSTTLVRSSPTRIPTELVASAVVCMVTATSSMVVPMAPRLVPAVSSVPVTTVSRLSVAPIVSCSSLVPVRMLSLICGMLFQVKYSPNALAAMPIIATRIIRVPKIP